MPPLIPLAITALLKRFGAAGRWPSARHCLYAYTALLYGSTFLVGRAAFRRIRRSA